MEHPKNARRTDKRRLHEANWGRLALKFWLIQQHLMGYVCFIFSKKRRHGVVTETTGTTTLATGGRLSVRHPSDPSVLSTARHSTDVGHANTFMSLLGNKSMSTTLYPDYANGKDDPSKHGDTIFL